MNKSPLIPRPSSLVPKIRRVLRGEVPLGAAVREAGRRARAAFGRRRERAMLERSRPAGGVGGAPPAPARLRPEFARMAGAELLDHFRTGAGAAFLPGFDGPPGAVARAQRELFPEGTGRLLEAARLVSDERAWPLLGFGVLRFGEKVEWRRDPASGLGWPLEYHADLRLVRGDGSDIRVLWELNRLGHLLALGRAYASTGDEKFSAAFFPQVENWRVENPVGFGPNWACAMEAALRAINLLAAFRLFRRSPALDEARLLSLLALFDEHGAHIRRNLEFSYIATSNHYLSDLAGLFWLGACVPELEAAGEWREYGLRGMLSEMDRQVLPDGADAEASTGYHRLVLELFLYSFILARAGGIRIEERYWRKLRAMLEYVRAYLRPDGGAPLVGDTDGGRVLPLVGRGSDDHAYLLALGAALFRESRFKLRDEMPEEVLWLLGEEGVSAYRGLPRGPEPGSAAFADAGTYCLRSRDLYMLFNASGAGLGGRGSHGHNDALSFELAACGTVFVRDPGTYVYTGDFRERHLFRSTAYHSTIEVDGAEQNTTDVRHPFVLGDEARPRVLRWETGESHDLVVAEHRGYARLSGGAVTHRRAVRLDRRGRFWVVEDQLTGAGEHTFRFLFHLAPGLSARAAADAEVEVCDRISGARFYIVSLEGRGGATLEPRFSSRDYGRKEESQAACWIVRARAPVVARWALVPLGAGEPEEKYRSLIERLREGLKEGGGGLQKVLGVGCQALGEDIS